MTHVQERVQIDNVQVMGVDADNRAVRSNMREIFEYIARLPFDSSAAQNAYLDDGNGKGRSWVHHTAWSAMPPARGTNGAIGVARRQQA